MASKNKQLYKINKLLQKQIVQRFGVFAVALMVIGSVGYFGLSQNQASHAAGVGILSMTNASGTSTTVVSGSTVSVTLFEDSGTDLVNSVQASVTYAPTQLQFVSMTEGTAFPTIAANSTATAGVVRVGRATLAASPVSGKNAVVTLNFKVLGTTGTTTLAYDPAFSFIVESVNNVNILTSNSGIVFTMKLPAPTVSSLSVKTGPTAGGTATVITGTNFVSGATVSFGGTAATASFVNATTINATAPAHAAGSVNVVVTNPDGQLATFTGGYSYVAPAPTITTITPASGVTTGGTAVNIAGTNFVSGATVTIGGVAAPVVSFQTGVIAVTAPAHAAGLVDVVVRNPDAQVATRVGGYTYTVPAPTVTAVTPALGPVTGGTTITVTGTNFIGVSAVRVGGTAATAVTVGVSGTTLTAVTPAHVGGLVAVDVVSATGTGTRASSFTYRSPAPTVTSVAPTSGTANGGSVVTITGANFVVGATVTVGGTAATGVAFISSTSIRVTTPAHAAGAATIVVTNPDTQTGSLDLGFNYLSLGDANNDGRVNAIDLSILITHDGEAFPAADFNGDGTVGAADMAILLGRWTW